MIAKVSGPPTVLLMGPTASGKSALSLALAQRFPLEIVSVDSAQVYRGMDIGTAKPDAATRARVPHHLIDIVDPTDAYSAARFCADAHARRRRDPRPRQRPAARRRHDALLQGADRGALRAAGPRSRGARAARRARRAAKAGRHCTPSSPASIRRRRRASRRPTRSGSSARSKCTRSPGRRSPHAAGRARGKRDAGAGRCASRSFPTDRARLHALIADRFDAMLEAGLVDELRGSARALCARSGAAVDALRRLSPGLGIPRRPHRSRDVPRHGDRRHAPAREAAVDVASRDARAVVRSMGARISLEAVAAPIIEALDKA